MKPDINKIPMMMRQPGCVLTHRLHRSICDQNLQREMLHVFQLNGASHLQGLKPEQMTLQIASEYLKACVGRYIVPPTVAEQPKLPPPWAGGVDKQGGINRPKQNMIRPLEGSVASAPLLGHQVDFIIFNELVDVEPQSYLQVHSEAFIEAMRQRIFDRVVRNSKCGAHEPTQASNLYQEKPEMKTAQHQMTVRRVLDLEGSHKFVGVTFAIDAKVVYLYKTNLELAVGDHVVVENSSTGLTTAIVVSLDQTPKDAILGTYKWIVSKVDRATYDKRLQDENDFVDSAVASMLRRDRQLASEAMVQSLDMNDDDKAAFMQSLKNLGAV